MSKIEHNYFFYCSTNIKAHLTVNSKCQTQKQIKNTERTTFFLCALVSKHYFADNIKTCWIITSRHTRITSQLYIWIYAYVHIYMCICIYIYLWKWPKTDGDPGWLLFTQMSCSYSFSSHFYISCQFMCWGLLRFSVNVMLDIDTHTRTCSSLDWISVRNV